MKIMNLLRCIYVRFPILHSWHCKDFVYIFTLCFWYLRHDISKSHGILCRMEYYGNYLCLDWLLLWLVNRIKYPADSTAIIYMSINSIKCGPSKTHGVFTRTKSDSAAGCSLKKVMERFTVHNPL